MKKKILTLTFTLILLIGLVAAVGVNASAATAVIDISAAIELCTYDDLAGYLEQLRPKTYFKLTGDIIVTDDTKDLSLPVDASGTFVLDLNGHEIIINSDKTTSVFNIGSYFSTEFHVINSSTTRSGITLNSITDGASVFYINDERSSLHIYEGIDIGVCLDGNYFGSQSLSPATLCGIRANKFDTIALHGADIYNLSSYGIGIRFDSDASGSKLILDGDVEISSKNAALEFRGISTGYPTVTIKTLHAKYEAALPVSASNYSSVSEYIAIKGMSDTAKMSDIAPSGTNGFYGTNADTSYILFINDTDYINNSKYKGKNISISYPSCGHSQGYECYLRLSVPGQIRPLHFTVCSYCGEKAAYNTCTFVTKAEATSEAHGHTAGYDCYCGYKTTQTLHYYTEYAKKAATCTTSGNKETMYVCRICTTYYDSDKNQIHGKAFLQNRIDPLGHDMVKVAAKAATCTKDGNIEYYDCSRCDHKSSDAKGNTAITNTVAAKTGHKEVKIAAVAATCTKEGKTEGKKCSVCGTVTVAQKAVAKKAHTYKSVTTKATLTKNGKVENKCSVCGNVKSTTTVYYPKTIKLSKTAYTYNGKVQTPSVSVKDSKGNTLKKDTDYTVKYESGRKSAGKYSVTITFKGKYSGTKTLTYTIAPKVTSKITASQTTTTITLKWNKVTGADGYRVYKYNSKTKKYEKLKDVTGTSLKISKLKAGTAYKYKVRAYTKDDGTIWGAYSSAFETATKPATPKITKISTTKGKASFTWSNVSGESGYQVYYSTKKDSGYKKVASYKTNVVKGSKSSLTSGKTYYFKVRAYKKTASGTVYSAWSSVKSIKIK